MAARPSIRSGRSAATSRRVKSKWESAQDSAPPSAVFRTNSNCASTIWTSRIASGGAAAWAGGRGPAGARGAGRGAAAAGAASRSEKL